MSTHLDTETLRSFFAGELPPEATGTVALHLLDGCELCQQKAQQHWYTGPARVAEPENGSVAEQAGLVGRGQDHNTSAEDLRWSRLADQLAMSEALVEHEKSRAPEAADRLLAMPLGGRMLAVGNSALYQTWALVEELLRRAWDLRFDDAHQLVEVAETALACANALKPGRYPANAVSDLRARCWSHVGNGFKILSDFPKAEACLRTAKVELGRGTGDPVELGHWLRLQVGLKFNQRRLGEAEKLSERYLAIARRLGDRHAMGEAKNFLGTIRANQDRVEEAITLLEESCDLLDEEVDVRFVANSRHNLIAMLDEAGRQEEALAQLADLRTLYQNLGDRISLMRLTLTEGEIAAKMNNHLLAEKCFLGSRNGFVASRLPVEAAISTLHLALLYLENGRFSDTKRLAEQMYPIFQSKGLEREAMAALLLFRESALRETVTTTMVTETLRLVRSIQARPVAARKSQ
jgi:tetratricopeptide (TPR) repeat protein